MSLGARPGGAGSGPQHLNSTSTHMTSGTLSGSLADKWVSADPVRPVSVAAPPVRRQQPLTRERVCALQHSSK